MVPHNPPLLVMADIPVPFHLTDLILPEPASTLVSLTPERYHEVDRLEAVLGGMAFTLTYQTKEEVSQNLANEKLEHIFCDPSAKPLACIAIALSDHIANAKHDPSINRALLQLAQFIGSAVRAHSIIWRPAHLSIGFDYFVETTSHYINGGPFPVLAQIAISENSDGAFETSGLSYFSGQEIKLSAPASYPPNEVIKRLIRIAHEIASSGPIDKKTNTEGFVTGETISFIPHERDSRVDITIVADKPRQLH